MTAADLRQILARMRGRRVLVLGDVMLDHFLFGHVERISPEAPVPVVRFEREEYRVGGAANVAHNLLALGAEPRLVGLVGRDEAAARLDSELAAIGLSTGGLVETTERCTTRKLRVVTRRNQQVARIDYESDAPLPEALEQALLDRAAQHVDGAAVVLISDYLKGAIGRRVAAGTIELAARHGIPVLVDPKVPHIDDYAGATLVTPNHHEAEAVTLLRIRTDEEARVAARAFRERARCAHVLITRGEQGMWLLEGDRDHVLPATAREVADVTGAGDTVIASMAAAMAAGAPMADAARLANLAAGLKVAKFGAATVTPDELLAATDHL
jgi:D-glycero-beta-D-manno-heptose-7-phosphate kinase